MKAWACVGTNGHIYFASIAPSHPQCEGRLEVYLDKKSALRNAISPDHVREIHITIHRKPEGGSGK